MRGIRTLHSTVLIPASTRTALKMPVKFDPRSRIINFIRSACPPRPISRLRACWAVHSPAGCRVTPRMRMRRARVLDHGQDASLGAAGQADGEEVAGQDHLGLGAQEPTRLAGSVAAQADAVGPEDLPHGRRRDVDSQTGQFPVDPAVAPSGVLPGQPQDQGLDAPAGRRPAGPAAPRPRRPAAPDDGAVPAHDRVRGDSSRNPRQRAFGITPSSAASRTRSRPVQLGAARLPPLQDRELVAQDQDLGGLPHLLTPGQPQPPG